MMSLAGQTRILGIGDSSFSIVRPDVSSLIYPPSLSGRGKLWKSRFYRCLFVCSIYVHYWRTCQFSSRQVEQEVKAVVSGIDLQEAAERSVACSCEYWFLARFGIGANGGGGGQSRVQAVKRRVH